MKSTGKKLSALLIALSLVSMGAGGAHAVMPAQPQPSTAPGTPAPLGPEEQELPLEELPGSELPGSEKPSDEQPGEAEEFDTPPAAPGTEPGEPTESEEELREQSEAPENDAEISENAEGPEPRSRLAATASSLGTTTVSQRISGADRFATAVATSKHRYPNGAKTVFLAMGMNFPDSLSAAPVAAVQDAPLLLTHSTTLTQNTKQEIQRLKPTTIVLVGGTGAVSAAVERSAKGLASKVVRVSGEDRYATSAALASYGWKQAPGAFIATGANYADALSAGAAAGYLSQPVLLVPGTDSTVPQKTAQVLDSLGANEIRIAGGTGVVSQSLERSLGDAGKRTVTRFGGADRYTTSALIVNGVFTTATKAYFAQGLNFPDALAGAAAAGSAGAPLLLVNETCIPKAVYDAHDRVKPQNTYLLGGTGVLSAKVQHGNECFGSKPSMIDTASWQGTAALYERVNALRYAAGVSGARVSETPSNYPAFRWSKQQQGKTFGHNTRVFTEVPWARSETIGWTGGYSKPADSARAMVSQWENTPAQKRNLVAAVSGTRSKMSVGFYQGTRGKNYATLIIGT